MITEILTTALLACSLGSSIIRNDPKRTIDRNLFENFGFNLTYSGIGQAYFTARTAGRSGEIDFSINGSALHSDTIEIASNQDEDYYSINLDVTETGGNYVISYSFDFNLDLNTYQEDRTYITSLVAEISEKENIGNITINDNGVDEDFDDGDVWYLTRTGSLSFSSNGLEQGNSWLSFYLINPNQPTYTYTETRNHCSRISGTGYTQLPETFTKTDNPYKIGFSCNDGYYFKTDGSGIITTGGIEILSVDYGNYPTISHLVYSTQVTITLNLPLANCSITLNPVTLSVQEVNDLYGDGFDDAKAIYGENVQFEWIKTAFDGMAGFFNIQILPNISLGFLMFAPIVVVAIVAIVRIIKHE